MPVVRGTRATGRAAMAGTAALCLLAGSAFVAPHSGAPSARDAALRGRAAQPELDVRPFASQPPAEEQPRSMSWASLASLMAAVGLVAGVATTPVRAEEAPAAEAAPAAAAAPAEPEAPAISTFETGGAFAKGGRKNKRPVVKAEKKVTVGSSSSSGNSVFVGSSAPEEGKKKIIISPADERDEDELSLSRTNRPLLALLALTPASIYIVFWTLGSLEII